MTPAQFKVLLDFVDQNPDKTKQLWDLSKTQALYNFDVDDLHKLLHIYRAAFNGIFNAAANGITTEIYQTGGKGCRCGCCTDYVALSKDLADETTTELARDEDQEVIIYQLAKAHLRHE